MPVFLQILFWVLTNWRDVYELVKEIIALINKIEDPQQKAMATKDLVTIFNAAHTSRDVGPFKNLICKLKGSCPA